MTAPPPPSRDGGQAPVLGQDHRQDHGQDHGQDHSQDHSQGQGQSQGLSPSSAALSASHASAPALPPVPPGPVGHLIPTLSVSDRGDSILGITPPHEEVSFQQGWLGVPGARAMIRGEVLAKLDERLYKAFDPLQARIHLHALERTPSSHALLFAASLPLWNPPEPLEQTLSCHASGHRPRLPKSMPFEFRLTPDLPQCVHLPQSGVRYVLIVELLVGRHPLSPASSRRTNDSVQKLVSSVPVHLIRHLPPGPLRRLLSPVTETVQAPGHPPAYSDEPSPPNFQASSGPSTAHGASSSTVDFPRPEDDTTAQTDQINTFASTGGVYVPPGYGLTPHVWSARYPTVVHVQLARTLFRRGEPMRINVLIPPPPHGVATEKGFSLRSVEARLVRKITVTEPSCEAPRDHAGFSGTDAASGNIGCSASSSDPSAPSASRSGSRSTPVAEATAGSGSRLPATNLPASKTKGKETVYEAQLSYSGKLARFNSSRAIVLRLALHSPYHIACAPGPSTEIDRALYDVNVSPASRLDDNSGPYVPHILDAGEGSVEREAQASEAALADVDASRGCQREGTACANISQESLFHKVEFEVRVRVAFSYTRSPSPPSSPARTHSTTEAGVKTKGSDASSFQAPQTSTSNLGPQAVGAAHSSSAAPAPPLRTSAPSQGRPRGVDLRFSQKVFIVPGIPPEAGVGLNSDGNPLWMEDHFAEGSNYSGREGDEPPPAPNESEGSAEGQAPALHSVRAEKMRAAEALGGAQDDENEAVNLGARGRAFEGFNLLEEFDGYEDRIFYDEVGAGPSHVASAAEEVLLGTGLGRGPPQPLHSDTEAESPVNWDAPPAEDEAPPPVGADDELSEFELRMGMEIGRRIAAIGAEGPIPHWTPRAEDDDLRPPPGDPPEELEAHADARAALAGSRSESPPMPPSFPAWPSNLGSDDTAIPSQQDGNESGTPVGQPSWDAPPASAPPADENHPDPMGLRLAAAARQLRLNPPLLEHVRSRPAATLLHAEPPPSFGDATAVESRPLPPQNFTYNAYPLPPSSPGSRRPSTHRDSHSTLVDGLRPALHPSSVDVSPGTVDLASSPPPPPPYRGTQELEPEVVGHRSAQLPSYADAGGLSRSCSLATPASHPSAAHIEPSTSGDHDQDLPTYAEYERR